MLISLYIMRKSYNLGKCKLLQSSISARPAKNSHTFPSPHCLNCILAGAGIIPPANALATRDFDRPVFSLTAFVDYARHLATTREASPWAVSAELITRTCHQIYGEIQMLEKRDPDDAQKHVKQALGRSKRPDYNTSKERTLLLAGQIARDQDNFCAYCGQAVSVADGCLDIVLPVGIDHTRINHYRKEGFWRIVKASGLAVVACPDCNHRKLRQDISGGNLWYGVRRHIRCFEPLPEIQPKAAAPGVAYLAGSGQRDRKSTRLNSSHGGISRMPSSA